MSYYYDDLRNIYHLITETERKKSASNRQQVAEIYGGRYGTRTTASGRKVYRDEPGEDEQLRQADAVRKAVHKKEAAASRERLKSKGKVPVRKDGTKVFEDFMKVIREKEELQMDRKTREYLEQVYLSARALEFDKWILFIDEML
jgi:hypothetical protein